MTTMTAARNDLEDGDATTTTTANDTNTNIFDGENENNNDVEADNDVVLASSSQKVPRGRWDVFSESMLFLSWIGGVVYISTSISYEIRSIKPLLLAMLLVVNLSVGILLLWRMCQNQRQCALVEAEAQQRSASNSNSNSNNAPQTTPDSSPYGVWERPVGRPLCCCDARSFFAVVLSLCWWFDIRRDAIVFSERWLGLGWFRSPVSVSIGVVIGAVTIQFVTWGLSRFYRKHPSCCCRFDPRSMLFAFVAGIVLLMSIAGAIVSWLRRVDAIEPLRSLLSLPPFDDSGTLSDWDKNYMYNGAAYVRNVTLDDPTTTEEEYCHGSDWNRVINVDVDVYFGGWWACPTLSDAQCQTTVSAEVSCDFLEFDIEEFKRPVKDKEYATNQDYYDAVYRHYHNSDNANINNNDYDPYGFNDDDGYDPDNLPPSRNSNWFLFTESIVGNCRTCEAMSISAINGVADQGCRATTDTHVFLGATIAACCCLAAVFVPKKK